MKEEQAVRVKLGCRWVERGREQKISTCYRSGNKSSNTEKGIREGTCWYDSINNVRPSALCLRFVFCILPVL